MSRRRKLPCGDDVKELKQKNQELGKKMNNNIIKSDKDVALEFVGKVRGYLSDAAHSFFKIGYELHKAQQGRHFKALGYESLEDLAEDAFGFSKTTTYDMLKVYNACRSPFVEGEMCEAYKVYSFSQLAAMRNGRFASPYCLTERQRVKPTDSVRAIKKYVSFFNKYTERHSVYPRVTLQEWLEQEEARQAELESSEQLQLGELVEESAEPEEQDETPGEIFRTSELQEVAEEEPEIEEQEEIEDETPDEEPDETESVSRETETEVQRYTFENREKIRAFYGDYANWERSVLFLTMWLKLYSYDFRNGMSVLAVESTSCKDIENMTADGKKVRYFWRSQKCTYEVSVLDMERYIATIKDEL